jgi:nucleoid DNA-binding protein
MSIFYKFAKNNDCLNDEGNKKEGVHPVLLSKKTYNTEDFAELLADKTNTRKWEMQRAIDAVFEGLEEVLSDGDIVNIKNFGSFQLSARFRKGKSGMANSRAESIEIKSVLFKASKHLKARIGKAGFERYNETLHPKRK